MDENLYSVKMRASLAGKHISGAERIVGARNVVKTVTSLAVRALSHPRGVPDSMNVKVERAGSVQHLHALPVFTETVETAEEGWERVIALMKEAGFARAAEIRGLFRETYAMRGAMLLDADTLERLEPDRDRGVRATLMDAADSVGGGCFCVKDHYAEAVVLATKVANAPGIVGEICVSDDPDYVTGYVASPMLGYRRITRLKEMGDACGGRIFLYRGSRENVEETVRFLEKQSVVVEGIPALPTAGERRFGILAEDMDVVRATGLERTCKVLASPTGPIAEVDGRRLVVLSSNDYLDLARDSRVTAAAAAAAIEWGAGSGGSRLATGTQPPHVKLETHLAAFKCSEAAISYSTGYMANVGAISAMAGPGDAILSDELNHASIIDGCRLSGAEVIVYRHRDMRDLDRKLAACRAVRRRIAVSDAVFSMDGDVLDLPDFLSVCRRHDAFSMVDEAHATGVLGDTGRGICEHFGCGLPDILSGTLSKALGSEGGYVCGSRLLVDWLRNRSRPFIFSTAPCAAAVAAADAALCVLEKEPCRTRRLRENVTFFVEELARRGVRACSESAIVPILVGDEQKALRMAEALVDRGFFVPAIRYPSVARGAARLRAAVMSAHSRDDLAAAAAAIAEVCNSHITA